LDSDAVNVIVIYIIVIIVIIMSVAQPIIALL